LAAEKTSQECAAVLGLPSEKYDAYEEGLHAPTLPELEVLSYILDIPLEHFWGSQAKAEPLSKKSSIDSGLILPLRHRMVGTQLQQIRTNKNIPAALLAEKTGIPETTLTEYEVGNRPIPLPDLETLIECLDANIKDFFDLRGPVGEWRTQEEIIQQFLELPPHVREFICKPVNRPYLDVAIRMSGLSVDTLRAVAEGLLEITY
jgi:transcriptional regulator with XRE-family HTH domain